jgi:hypothetical protein
MTKPWNNALLYERAAELGTIGPTANVGESGQMGAGPDVLKLDASTPLVLNDIIVVVLSVPGFWNKNPMAQQVLKNIMEVQAKSVSGIDLNYRVNSNAVQYSRDGQQLNMPANVTREAVSPTFTYNEFVGSPIWNFHRKWIFNIQHPDSQVSALSAENDEKIPWLLSTISASIAIIQPDPTGHYDNIIEGAIITGLYPQETGSFGWKKDVSGTPETPERSITYNGIIHHNDTTRETCKSLLKLLNFHKPNFQKAANYDSVDSNIARYGIDQSLKDLLSQSNV